MILRRFFDERLAQASYIVACDRSRLALVVDPNRNVAQYVEAAAAQNLRIVAVTETHIHADYVSGARELALKTGARLYLSDAGDAGWKYRYASADGAELLSDGASVLVGDVRVEAVHTPGHTPEHMTLLVTDTAYASEPMGALTGDFIFVGDVGRPDLLERVAGFEGTMESGARRLFASLQAFRKRPDYLQIWPGHGAGSACGKTLGAMPQTTLGYEKLFNWALAETDENSFVEEVLAGQPEPPAYFATMKRVNRDGPPTDAPRVPGVATAADIRAALGRGATVVDTRAPGEFAGGHAKGSINIPRNKAFLNWAGAVLPYDEDIFFVGDSSERGRSELALDLSLIGIGSAAGVYPSKDMGALADATLRNADASELRTNPAATVLDVRSRTEFADGHIAGALHIPLAELTRRLDEVPPGEVIVHCQGGTRSAIAASILQREGTNDVANMPGGFPEWERAGNPVERGEAARA